MKAFRVHNWLPLLILLAMGAPSAAQEGGDFVQFPDGVEVLAPGGRLRPTDVAAALERVESQIAEAQLELAQRMLEVLDTRAGGPVPEAGELRMRIRQAEFSSVVILRDGQRIEGRLVNPFRADRLGLETKEEISPDLVRRISVEYHLGWSQVSQTFYPLTLVETEFRNGRTLIGRTTQETPVTVETRDGRLVKVMMGRAYQLFREERLAKQLVAGDGDRVARILIYPFLNPDRP